MLPRTFAPCCAVLTVAVAIGLGFAIWYAQTNLGRPAVFAAIAAAIVCWGSALFALFLTDLVKGTPGAMNGILLATLVRTGVPLAAAMLLKSHPVLAEGGVFGWIVAFYLPTLLVETVLSVGLVSAASAKGGAS